MKSKSTKQEERVGRRVPGSGGIKGMPLDRLEGPFGTECKYTDNKSYSLKLETWDRVKKEALSRGLEPCIELMIQGTILRVISEDAFAVLKECLERDDV